MSVQGDINITDSELVEEEGVYVGLTRDYIVDGITTTYSDTRRLSHEAMLAAGVPVHGDTMPGNTNMVCVGRQARMAKSSNTQAIVTCTYMPYAQSKSTFIFSGGTSLTQTSRQRDIFGNNLVESHTYPADDPNFPSQTKSPGADVSVLIPTTSLRRRALLT